MFLLCSDGFYHTMSPEEVGGVAQGQALWMQQYLKALGDLCRTRGETDNLTAVALARCASSCQPTQLMMSEETDYFLQVLVDVTQTHAPRKPGETERSL